MSLAVSPEHVSRLLHDSEFLQGFGFRLESLGDAVCTLRFPFQRRFERPGGIATGRLGEAAGRSVTIDLAASFVRASRELNGLAAGRSPARARSCPARFRRPASWRFRRAPRS
jgi:acyl-coenzyme A thioesterase PaaI-like protein